VVCADRLRSGDCVWPSYIRAVSFLSAAAVEFVVGGGGVGAVRALKQQLLFTVGGHAGVCELGSIGILREIDTSLRNLSG